MTERVAFLLAAMTAAWAQGSVGTLNGTVLDPAGLEVPGASVVATNRATGEEHKTTSTSAGAYTLPYLPSGTYTIRVKAPGFRTSEADNVILRVAQTLTINLTLEIGEITEQVTVSDKPPLLESGTSEIGRYVSVEEYKSWPILMEDGQRQIQSFIFSSLPGTTGNTFLGTINGGQQFSHEILIEGIPVGRSDLSGGNNVEFSPSVEAIGEFKLQTGAIRAQYNGGQTAVANFNIKTGTNDLHGSAYLYLQNEALNTLDLQTKTLGGHNTKFREDNWGYSLGGPVYIPKVYHGRNKTFWFTNFEKTHIDSLVLNGFVTLPTPDFKKGDFSRLFDPSFTGNPLSGTEVGADALGRPIIFGQIYDPLSTRTGPDGKPIRDPFPGNIIPGSRWDPVAKNIVQSVGIVDPTFDTMIRNIQCVCGVPFFDLHIFGLKMDHNISGKHHMSGFYNQSYRNTESFHYLPIPGPPTNGFLELTTPGHMVRLSLNSTLTPTVLNRVAAGYNRFLVEFDAPTVNKDWASRIGLQNLPGTAFPVMNFSGNEYQGETISGLGGGARNTSPNGSYIYQDDLTWIHGKHSFRFGYEYKRYFFNAKSLSDAGHFNFSPRSTDLPGYLDDTGHAFASFLLGAADSASHGVNILSEALRQPQHGFYAMDDWKVTPKLTVNAGLRWEVIPPFYETTGRMSEIDLNARNAGAGNRPGALVFASHGSRFNNTYWREFGPRLGLAYQVNSKMVVRAGYAMTNTPPICNKFGYGFDYGFDGTVNVPAGTSPTGFVDDPAIYLREPFPILQGTLPNTDPSSANYQSSLRTTARDANRPGYVQNWNFTIQYQFPKQTVLEVAYVGNKGTRLWGQSAFSELDGLPAKMLSMGDILNDPVSLHPQYTPYAGFDTSLTVAQALRPYPQFFGVQEAFPYNTNSNYNSLQATLTRHLTSGLVFLAAYTFSKAIGYVDGNGPAAYYIAAQDYYNRGLERSVTTFNYPQDFKLTWVYDTPAGKGRRFDLGWANYIVGGWQLAAIHNYRSGDAIALFQAGLNIPNGFASGIRPDSLTGVPETLGGAPTKVDVVNGTPYLNPAAFSPTPVTPNGVPLRVGTAPRVLPNIRGPHHMDETFRMSKKFPLYKQKENTFFHLGVTMTNPLNRIGRYIGDTSVSDADFGKVFANGGGRTLQLDARVEF